jgi:2,4-dienoyl-CoA reductase-like NADH-dependent reductase (Old Yellow Enzyme family)
MKNVFDNVTFTCGKTMKNRLMLAPLTNWQSHEDGTLSSVETKWLEARARGGFGLTMTAAAHVQPVGQGFPGQLAIHDDCFLPALTHLADVIREAGSLSLVQLHHAGFRAEATLIAPQQRVAPSDNAEFGARALTTAEVAKLRDDFIEGAVRAQKAGFDGVEIHGAHSYIICQFLSPEYNQRTDQYGGSLENRCRLLFEVIDGIRQRCGKAFLLGLRLSPERNGIPLAEAIETAREVLRRGDIDFLDMSLWDVFKKPIEAEFQGRSLLSYFTELDRGNVKLGAAGKLHNAAEIQRALDEGLDFVLLGRAAILHADYPERLRNDAAFAMRATPVTRDYLRDQALGEPFIDYLSTTWPDFVE